MKSGWITALFIGVVGVLTFAGPAAADTYTYSVSMSGAEEVPPVVTGGTGLCIVTFDDVTGACSVSGSFSGLTSNATLAHVHGPAAPGANAGILITLTETGGTSGSVSGSGTIAPGNIADFLNGLMYLNIHTVNNGTGEIRGQITQLVPALPWGWMAALVALAVGGGDFVVTRRGAVTAAA